MTKRLKTWTAVGFSALVATSANAATQLHTISQQTPLVILGEGGEGGEGGAVDGQTYALESTDANAFKFEADDEIEAYADMVLGRYSEAAQRARELRKACIRLLDNPSSENLDTARTAWVKARRPYMQTEPFRFYDGPIEKLEGAINEAPITPKVIDDWINNSKTPISVKTLAAANQKTAEHDVTTGYHAIEYLLWGTDSISFSDYVKGTIPNDRRRTTLLMTTMKLNLDLQQLEKQWNKSGSNTYRNKFLKLPEREALGRIVNGMAVLAGVELSDDRITKPLEANNPREEQSDFANTTSDDFKSGVEGIALLWRGDGKHRGLNGLVKSRKAEVADRVETALTNVEAKVHALPQRWDTVFGKPATAPERKSADEFVSALKSLTEALKAAGNTLGVLVLLPEEN